MSNEIAKTKEEKLELVITNAYKNNHIKDISNDAKGTVIRISLIADVVNKVKQYFPKLILKDNLAATINTLYDLNPKLKECSITSLIGAVQQIAVLNLDPSQSEVYLIPYGGQIQVQVSYAGFKKLAENAGCKNFNAVVIYEEDYWKITEGRNRDIEHIVKIDSKKRNPENIVAAYATATLPTGEFIFEVIDKLSIERRRKASPFQKDTPSGAWLHYESMAKAKAMKALAKSLPKTSESKALYTASLVDEQVVQRSFDQKELKEFTEAEHDYQYDEDYSVDLETGEVQDKDNEISSLIDKEAK